MMDVRRRISMTVVRCGKMRNIWGARVVAPTIEDETVYIGCVFDTHIRISDMDDDRVGQEGD